MCSGERPIGAAKDKQTHTMASCQPPPPPQCQCHEWVGGWVGRSRCAQHKNNVVLAAACLVAFLIVSCLRLRPWLST